MPIIQWKRLGSGILMALGALLFASAIALLFGLILMLLWNWLMPGLFGLSTITYWQAWGIILLSHLLFKGGGHCGSGSGFHGRPGMHGKGHPNGKGWGPSRGPGWGHGCGRDGEEWRREFRRRMRHRYQEDPSSDKEDRPAPETRDETE